MKVLMVVSSATESGAERHSLLLAGRLKQHGIDVQVVAPPREWMRDHCLAKGIPFHPLDFRQVGALKSALFLRKLQTTERFDVVHAHLSRATYASLLLHHLTRVPLVASVHVQTRDPIFRLVARRTNILVAVSDFISAGLVAKGIPNRSIRVVHNGTDFGEIPVSHVGDPAQLGLPEGKVLVGLVGRVAEPKGHHLAVEALSRIQPQVPAAHLVFVGREEGEFPGQLRSRIAELGIQGSVSFLGARNDVAALLDHMNFTVLPSLNESFGLVAIESMARGKPIIAFRTGGLVEVVEDGAAGYLIPPSAADLAAKMQVLATNHALCDEMGQAAKQWVEDRFSAEAMVKAMISVYREAAGGKK